MLGSYSKYSADTFDLSTIRINENNIYKALGMIEADSDEHLSLLIDKFIDRSKKLCKPKLSYTLFHEIQLNPSKGELHVNGISLNLGREVTAFLSKSSGIALFTATCGVEIENYSKQLMKEGHMLEGLIVDIIGSELAEELAEQAQLLIEETARTESLKITNRYSPGYCNWPVSDQQNLFKLLDNNVSGINLTPSSLMIPIKSVSGIVGIGEDVKKMAYKCSVCSDDKCIMRKKIQ
jgi:hypothetical protein